MGHGPASGMMEPAKLDVKALKKVFSYAKSYLLILLVSIFMAAVSAAASLIGPNKISDLTNEIYGGIYSPTGVNMDKFVPLAIFLVCLYATGAVAGYIQQVLMAVVTQGVSKKLRTDINKKIDKMPLSYFDTTQTGDILSRITNDVDTISQTMGSSLADLASSLILIIGCLIMMFIVNWILALITIATSLIGFFGMGAVLKKSRGYFKLRQGNLGQMNGNVEEIFTNSKVVKAYNATGKAIETFGKINAELYKNNKMSQFLSGMMGPFMGFAGNLSYVAIFVVGTSLALNNAGVTFGTIISFTLYSRLFGRPLSSLAQAMTSFQQASAASTRVFEMLSAKEMDKEEGVITKLPTVKGDVEFEHVNFSYNSSRTIINDFSSICHKGQKIAIVGPTGAGKTTMVNLLMRFYEVNAGSIKIDGVDTRKMSRETVHSLFDMILQDTWLFTGTLRENLVFNKKNVTDEELDKAVEAVGLTHFVHTLKRGYETPLNDSMQISEGQKQQITIARAILRDAPLLILDEATSSVDTRTEIKIQQAMDNLTKGRTSFVIAHRLSTIKNADAILVMRDGDIVEVGTHKELLKKNGFYAELYNSQFQVVDEPAPMPNVKPMM